MKRAGNRTISDRIMLTLPEGMLEAVDASRESDETRVAFIRTAIANELARRLRLERKAAS